jgi:hypothetical protein
MKVAGVAAYGRKTPKKHKEKGEREKGEKRRES